jgi:hypothetical protein
MVQSNHEMEESGGLDVSVGKSKAKRSIGPTRAVHAAAWAGRISVEVLEICALAATAAIAYPVGKMLRRVNRRGLLGWGTVSLAVLLLATVAIEIVELV